MRRHRRHYYSADLLEGLYLFGESLVLALWRLLRAGYRLIRRSLHGRR